MSTPEETIRLFHRKLFSWAESYIAREYELGFWKLIKNEITRSEQTFRFMEGLSAFELGPFRQALVRRCYRPLLLKWLGEPLNTNELDLITRYEGHCASSSFISINEAGRTYRTEDRKRFRKDLGSVFPNASPQDGTLRMEHNTGGLRIVTFVDAAHRNGSISYSHIVFDRAGTQISQIPLCVSSWCGLSSGTSWKPKASEDFPKISERIQDYIGEFLKFVEGIEAENSSNEPTGGRVPG